MSRLIIFVPDDDCSKLTHLEINNRSYDIKYCTGIVLKCIPGNKPEIAITYFPPKTIDVTFDHYSDEENDDS